MLAAGHAPKRRACAAGSQLLPPEQYRQATHHAPPPLRATPAAGTMMISGSACTGNTVISVRLPGTSTALGTLLVSNDDYGATPQSCSFLQYTNNGAGTWCAPPAADDDDSWAPLLPAPLPLPRAVMNQ